MEKNTLRATLPYAVGLVIAALLYHYAQQIEYSPRPGNLGPDFWPKLAIGLMAIVCLFEICRSLLGLKVDARGVADALEQEEASEEPVKTYPWLLTAGIVLVLGYAVVVTTLGFLLATFIFLAAFMYIGRYRNHIAIWATSLGVTMGAALIFMRFAYVSLPRGTPPFDAVTDFIRMIIGA